MEPQVKKLHAVVAGGVNMDICGKPALALRMRDSNPGFVSLKPGGVGRNIAHNLCLLGMDVSLIAAIGGDVYGSSLMDGCRSLGMDMSMARVEPQRRSSTYLYVTDEMGDMCVGIADMDIAECVTPEHLASCIGRINSADALVLDTNLSADAIRFLAAACTVPIYSDPVSTAKAMKLLPVLDRIYALKPNALEARYLTGEAEPEKAAERFLEMGVKRVFISLGTEGMLYASADGIGRVPCCPANMIDATGAGDAAMAAIIWGGTQGFSAQQCAAAATKAGALTVECEFTNSPDLCPQALI